MGVIVSLVKQLSIYAMIALVTFFIGGAVLAESALIKDFDGCVNSDSTSTPDQIILSCTAVIRSPKAKAGIRAFSLIKRGMTYREKKGDYDQALADYSAAIRVDPHNKWVYYPYELRAGIYEKLGTYDQAIADLGKAIQLFRDSPEYLYARRGYLYNVVGNYDLAVADFTEAIRLN
jgi:tetratricopeptide (TPR) repeat protein